MSVIAEEKNWEYRGNRSRAEQVRVRGYSYWATAAYSTQRRRTNYYCTAPSSPAPVHSRPVHGEADSRDPQGPWPYASKCLIGKKAFSQKWIFVSSNVILTWGPRVCQRSQ